MGGGDTNSFGVVLSHELEVLDILRGNQKVPNLLKEGGGGHEVLPCLEGVGGGGKFPILWPPSP